MYNEDIVSCTCACHEGKWENGGVAHLFLTSTLDWGEWSALLPGRFTAEKETAVPTVQGSDCVPEPDWTISQTDKYLALTGNVTTIIRLYSPWSSPFTDSAVRRV